MNIKELKNAVILFAGDSGDGIQLTGAQFSQTVAFFGNDLNTLPDFPAEIRAPSGTIAGVSGFQIHFGSTKIEKQPRYEAVFLTKFYFKTAKAFS